MVPIGRNGGHCLPHTARMITMTMKKKREKKEKKDKERKRRQG